jgi:hypothetical protein
MSISLSGVSPTPSVDKPASTSSTLTAKQSQSAVQQFLEYAKMTPAERLHAEMLSQLGLTEDQFKAMSPADQQNVEDKIREMIKKQLAGSGDTRTGMITDKTA